MAPDCTSSVRTRSGHDATHELIGCERGRQFAFDLLQPRLDLARERMAVAVTDEVLAAPPARQLGPERRRQLARLRGQAQALQPLAHELVIGGQFEQDRGG
jgi:hypothetical protein